MSAGTFDFLKARVNLELAGHDKVDAGLLSTQTKLKALAATTAKASAALTATGAAIIAPLAGAYRSFARMQSNIAMVSTMLEEPQKHIPGFSKKLDELRVKYGETGDALSKGLYDILSASIAPQKATEVLEVAVRSAKAGFTDSAVAVDAMTTILNSYKLSAEKAGDVSDWMFGVVKRGKLTYDELAQHIGKVASTASAAGISLEELGSMISIMTRNGLKAPIAISSINSFITKLTAASEESKQVAKEMFNIDMSEQGFKDGGGLAGFIDKLKNASVEQIRKLFPDAEAARGAIMMVQSYKELGAEIDANVKRAGNTDAAMSNVMGTAQMSMDALGETIKVAYEKVGGALDGFAGRQISEIQRVVAEGAEWIDQNRKLVVSAAILGKHILYVAAAAGTLSAGMKGLSLVIAGMRGFDKAVDAVGSVMGRAIGAGGMAGKRISDIYKETLARKQAELGAKTYMAALESLAGVKRAAIADSNNISAAYTAESVASQRLLTCHLEITPAALAVSRAHNLLTSSLMQSAQAHNAAAAASSRSMLALTLKNETAGMLAVSSAAQSSMLALRNRVGAQERARAASQAFASASFTEARVVNVAAEAFAASKLKVMSNTAALKMSAAASTAGKVGWQGLTSAARGFTALPISGVVAAIAAALYGVKYYLEGSARDAARHREDMEKLVASTRAAREEADKARDTDALRIQRLQQLSEKTSLNNAEQIEAVNIIDKLKVKYGDLGMTIDSATGSLNGFAAAQKAVNDAMKFKAIDEIEAEIKALQEMIQARSSEASTSMPELTDSQALNNLNTLGWGLKNPSIAWESLLQRIFNHGDPGREFRAQLDESAEKNLEDLRRIQELRERLKAIKGGSSPLTGPADHDVGLQERIEQSYQEELTAIHDVERAERRLAEIEKQLSREKRSNIENEIEDIRELGEERRQLIEALYDDAKHKADKTLKEMNSLGGDNEKWNDLLSVFSELDKKAQNYAELLHGAEGMTTARVDAVMERERKRKEEEDARQTEAGRKQFERNESSIQRERDNFERSRASRNEDQYINRIAIDDPESAAKLLKVLMERARKKAEDAYREAEELNRQALDDGKIDEDEQRGIDSARSRYSDSEMSFDRYAQKLDALQENAREELQKTFEVRGAFGSSAAALGFGLQEAKDPNVEHNKRTADGVDKLVADIEKGIPVVLAMS